MQKTQKVLFCFSYKSVKTSNIGEVTFGVQPGYEPERLTSQPINSNAERNALAKSVLEVSTDERVNHPIEISPSFTITLAILFEVSTKSAMSALIL